MQEIPTKLHPTYIYTLDKKFQLPKGLTLAVPSSLTSCHVVEDILHGLAVREGAGGVVSAHLLFLLSPLALVCMQEQHQLLLNLLALLRV